jgi:hypothetical protein
MIYLGAVITAWIIVLSVYYVNLCQLCGQTYDADFPLSDTLRILCQKFHLFFTFMMAQYHQFII